MKFTTLFAVTVALSTTNATFLKKLGGGSYGGSTGGSSEGSVQSPCGESGSCDSSAQAQPCEQQPCEQQLDCNTGATGTVAGEAQTSPIPTDIKSQVIGAISQLLETTFSGSGAMLSNLIG